MGITLPPKSWRKIFLNLTSRRQEILSPRSWRRVFLTPASWRRILEGLTTLFHIAATVIMGIIMMLVTVEAILRYGWGESLNFTHDSTEFSMVLLTYLPAAFIFSIGRHIRMELFVSRLQRLGRVRRASVNIFCLAACLFLFVFLTWEGWDIAWSYHEAGAKTDSLVPLPVFLKQVWLPIGGAVIVLLLISEISRNIGLLLGKAKREEEGPEEPERIAEEILRMTEPNGH